MFSWNRRKPAQPSLVGYPRNVIPAATGPLRTGAGGGWSLRVPVDSNIVVANASRSAGTAPFNRLAGAGTLRKAEMVLLQGVSYAILVDGSRNAITFDTTDFVHGFTGDQAFSTPFRSSIEVYLENSTAADIGSYIELSGVYETPADWF